LRGRKHLRGRIRVPVSVRRWPHRAQLHLRVPCRSPCRFLTRPRDLSGETMKDQPLRDSYDLVIIGSGNGGMTAAITGALLGLDVVILEKGELFGGSSALSGGAVWIPNNHANQRGGLEDSFEAADRYLKHLAGDVVDESRRHAYLREGPEMLSFLEERTRHVRYRYTPGYP